MRVRPLSKEAHLQLIRTARRQAPATMWLKGGHVLNVYTREWQQVHVVTAGERIAYVGESEPLVDDDTQVIDASGRWLVPGYIEPHAHPFQWYTPSALSDFALQTGTTTLVSDTLVLASLLPLAEMEELMEALSSHPVKQFFWARLDSQSRKRDQEAFRKEGIERLLAHPLVIQGGELTDWGGVLTEDEIILDGLKRTGDIGKRMEGHHPGASVDTLNIAAAAGITACHESITAEDVLHRLRLGLYATLRHSSIRPDLPELVAGLKRLGIPWQSRLMLTSDGSTPPMMRHGFMDYTLRVAIEAGMPAIDAYVLATLNPAVYYGLDGEIGGIAPGRIADMLLLADPADPTPQLVIANGRRVAEEGRLLSPSPAFPWERYRFPAVKRWGDDINTEWFEMRIQEEAAPVLQMVNAVITRLSWEALPKDERGAVSLADDPELAVIALLDPASNTLTRALVRGFGSGIEALASTYTASAGCLVIGRDPKTMAEALRRVGEIGGGVVMIRQGNIVYECALPLGGRMTDLPMAELIDKAEAFDRLMRSHGYSHIDPIYSLLFFTATHLPFVRLTTAGLYDVKQGRILVPSTRLE
ncbi:adenine deaminase [Brevibacillus sp. SYP-B805]|uniref:adenine deaminase C-terminal domain-containing protein n=1 Tax=Brevibacillus sp. SYP-B805 TaxID=1578199 RepID=UPI0013EDFB9F|nr:adenine deaminase C-terminal domain-containing protein [Brevibacillus sp. SYP-B805]NGQ97019.1 adenine deaminase [Brevibacillus sp. SYP-B805]